MEAEFGGVLRNLSPTLLYARAHFLYAGESKRELENYLYIYLFLLVFMRVPRPLNCSRIVLGLEKLFSDFISF